MGDLTLYEQKRMLADHGLDEGALKAFYRASDFHGHICPGLATGVSASLSYLKNRKRSEDEELVAIVENDACGVDAIQALLGCTFGKGNLIFRDHGKSVYTFLDRNTGMGLRYSQVNINSSVDEGSLELFSRVRSGEATEDEKRTFQELWIRKAAEVVRTGEELFDIREVDIQIPEKARIFESFFCDECGEKVGAHRAVDIDGKKLCIPCSEEEGMDR